MCAAASPIRARGVRTVVRVGSIWSLPVRSLKPAIATREGTGIPRRKAAIRAPCARSSLQKKMASTAGRCCMICSNRTPPSASEEGAGLSHASVGS